MQNPAREALAELVRLKTVTERIEAIENDLSRGGGGMAPLSPDLRREHAGLVFDYLARKDATWNAARAALALPAPEPIGYTTKYQLSTLEKHGEASIFREPAECAGENFYTFPLYAEPPAPKAGLSWSGHNIYADDEGSIRAVKEAVDKAALIEEWRRACAERNPEPPAPREPTVRWDLLESLCAWLLQRYGPDSPEGREASFRLVEAQKHAAPREPTCRWPQGACLHEYPDLAAKQQGLDPDAAPREPSVTRDRLEALIADYAYACAQALREGATTYDRKQEKDEWTTLLSVLDVLYAAPPEIPQQTREAIDAAIEQERNA